MNATHITEKTFLYGSKPVMPVTVILYRLGGNKLGYFTIGARQALAAGAASKDGIHDDATRFAQKHLL